MNYLLIVIILGLGAVIYCMHEQDAAQIISLERQVAELSKDRASEYQPPRAENAPSASSAIDNARAAAAAASGAQNIGTITTTDGKTYTNNKVLKQDADGVVFNNDTGIIKVPYWKMTPEEQKQFGYNIQDAAAAAAAQARYQDQQAAAGGTGTPAAPAPATTTNPP